MWKVYFRGCDPEAVLLSTAQFGTCQDQGVAKVTGC